jgi:hypothetical protein
MEVGFTLIVTPKRKKPGRGVIDPGVNMVGTVPITESVMALPNIG